MQCLSDKPTVLKLQDINALQNINKPHKIMEYIRNHEAKCLTWNTGLANERPP